MFIDRKTAVLLAALACPVVATAGPGRAGLWEVTTSLNFGIGGYQISEEQAEQMRQFGLDVPGISTPFVAQQCITPQQAARDELPKPEAGDSGCALRNVRHEGTVWRADIACAGSLQGSGALVARFTGNTKFDGTWQFKGRSSQLPTDLEMSNPFSGRWLGENCGKLRP